MGMEATWKPLCGLPRTPEGLAGEIRPPRNSPARVPPCVEVRGAEVHAASWPVLLEGDKARLRSLAQRVGVDAKALGRSGEVKPSVLLTVGTEAGDDAVGYTVGKPVEQIIDQRQWVGAVGVRHTVPSINPAPSPPGCPPSFSISYLTPWPPARSQRSLCTWPHPAHLCCGGSRKGVSGLERSGEAETPFLKARRRATNHHRAGGQGVRLGVRPIDEHPDEHARQADGFESSLAKDYNELTRACLKQLQGEWQVEGSQESGEGDRLPHMEVRAQAFGFHLAHALGQNLAAMTLDVSCAFFIVFAARYLWAFTVISQKVLRRGSLAWRVKALASVGQR